MPRRINLKAIARRPRRPPAGRPGPGAEIAAWADRLHSNIVRYAVSVVFGERPHPTIAGTLNTASGVVVDLGEGAFLLTAAHVITRALERARDERRFHFMAGPVALELPDRVLAVKERLDLATVRLTEAETSAIEEDNHQVVRPDRWPPPVPAEGDAVVLVGFPAKWRERASWTDLHLSAGLMRAFVRHTADDQFTTHLEPEYTLKRDVDIAGSRRGAFPVAGLSGGPAFLVPNTTDVLTVPRLCGVVKQGRQLRNAPRGHFLVIYARLDRLRRDGSIG